MLIYNAHECVDRHVSNMRDEFLLPFLPRKQNELSNFQLKTFLKIYIYLCTHNLYPIIDTIQHL